MLLRSATFLFATFITLVMPNDSDAYKILAVFGHPGKSHFRFYAPYLEKLAAKGHQVLTISHFHRKHSVANYTDIDLLETSSIRTVKTMSLDGLDNFNQITAALTLRKWGAEACKKTLEHPEVQKIIKSNDTFDLLVTETFSTDCYLTFAHQFKIPSIAFSPCALMPWVPDKVGHVDNPSYTPNHFSESTDHMDFGERVINTLSVVFHKFFYCFFMAVPVHRIASNHFGDNLPTMSDLGRNTSMIFVNSHFSLSRPRPLVPGVIEVAGLHIKEGNKLSKFLFVLAVGTRKGWKS
ncbi:UDP-glycosyltransferase UGT5-like [Periplaneta americana]|uniref:UDP-glycosyltransferase UGT5-like n=1 Tax=Periplaneta americana TaxID=6978 RepID=UPI0037E762F6